MFLSFDKLRKAGCEVTVENKGVSIQPKHLMDPGPVIELLRAEANFDHWQIDMVLQTVYQVQVVKLISKSIDD